MWPDRERWKWSVGLRPGVHVVIRGSSVGKHRLNQSPLPATSPRWIRPLYSARSTRPRVKRRSSKRASETVDGVPQGERLSPRAFPSVADGASSVSGCPLQFVPTNDNTFVMIVWITRKNDGWGEFASVLTPPDDKARLQPQRRRSPTHPSILLLLCCFSVMFCGS